MQAENSPRPLPLHIFLSFAHEDRAFRDALDKHLSSLKRAGLIDDWHELEILPGSDQQETIDEHLNQADIILLFISSDFIASKYLYGVQMQQALAKHDAGQARVIPLHIRSALWYRLPFAKLEGLPTTENRPVAEWENSDQAYLEIVEGVRKTIAELATDPALQSPPPTQSSPLLWNIPYPRNKFFTGRDALLQSLQQIFVLDQKNTISRQAISGLAGIGKTQLALEYAYRYKHEYQAILWLKGDSAEDLLASFLALAPILNLPEQKEADQHIVIAAIQRSLFQIPKWLLIIDNLDAFELLDELIPTRGHGHILITTRSQTTGSATLNNVEKLTPEDGALLLLRRAKILIQNAALESLSDSSITDAKTICKSLDGLPLALDQAGAYIEGTKTSLSKYIDLYQKHEIALLKQRGKFATGHPSSVATTLALCLTKVSQHNPAFIEILFLCAFLHPDTIPLEIFTVGAPNLGPTLQALISAELDFNSALETLLDLSLLHRNTDTETISIHRLVQVVLQDEMKADIQQLWAERTIKVLSHLFPKSEPGIWPACQQYLPHALLAANLIKRWSFSFPEAAHLLLLAGKYLYDIASYSEALKLCEQALTIAEQTYGNEHPETARTLHYLGNIHESLGHYPQAQSYYERAREIAERAWGPDQPETARILNDLGELFHTLDQLPLAEDYYKRALEIREKHFGLEHLETASSLNNLAGIYDEQGHYTQAEQLYKQALELREGLRGPYHPDTAESLSNLARFYRIIGRYREARPLYERSIIAYEHALGPEHPRLATCYNNFAVFCLAIGDYTQAEELLNQALKIRVPLLGLHHPNTAGSWNHLARVYSKQGKYEQAKALYEQALSVCEQELGRQHPSTTSILSNLGELYLMQGDETQAEALLTEALTNIREAQEPGHPTAAPVLNLLGELHLARAEYAQAELFLTEALEIRQQTLETSHPDTALSLKSLGNLALATNNPSQAKVLYQQALDIILPLLGPNHPDIIALIKLSQS